MFNNDKVNLQCHSGLNKFYGSINEQQQKELLSVILNMEQLLNKNLEEKEKLFNIVNNMQIQTQVELENEITKITELNKQITSQKLIISKQLEEIGQLNSFVMQKKKERRSLYSSPLQTSNKQGAQLVSLPVPKDYYQKLYDEECRREEEIFKIWKQFQLQSYQKVKELQDVMDTHLQEQYEKYDQSVETFSRVVATQEEQLNKYKVAFTMLLKYDGKRPIAELLQMAQSLNQENSNSEYYHEQLIDTIIDFSNKRDQLYQLQQQSMQKQEIVSGEEYQKLKKELIAQQAETSQIEEQRGELLQLSQQMNEKINLQQQQITSMNKQISQLTQLFAKSLQDLETVQEENELLRKSSHFTTRTSEVYSRFSVGADDRLLKCLSSVSSNYNSQSTKSKCSKSLKNKSMISQLSKSYFSQNNEDELCNLLDTILTQGFSQKIIQQLASWGNGGLKKRIKDLLFVLYNNNNEIDALFDSINMFISEQQLPVRKLELGNEGMSKTTSRLEHNSKICCEMLHHLIDRQSKSHSITTITSSLSDLSKVLLKLCQGNDDVIVQHIDKHIEISKQLHTRKDKQLRDLQFSTCKMIMEIFKKWKQNYIRITSILYSISKGLQQGNNVTIEEDLQEMQQSDLGKVIVKELNKLFQLLI